jgi:type I restriction enzyme M protein
VLKKSKKDNKILFIDASAEFVHSGNKNKLSDENRKKILEAFKNRQDLGYFSKLVENKDIVDNDCNLSVSSYVVPKDTKETVDIKKLNKEIDEVVKRQERLRKEIDEIVEEIEGK